jgi:imidazolonepropionase-like amidohydrolase
MRRLSYRAAAVVALLAATTVPASAQTIAITGGRVFPVSGAPIDNGTVLIRDGRIVAVGSNVTIPQGAERIDATGKWVTPGIINPATQLGLIEIGAVADTRDISAARPGGVAAAFTVWEGFNPRSVLLAPARNDGITSVVVMPQGGLISGQAAVINLREGGLSEMLLRSPVAMMGQVGAPQRAGLSARGELLGRLRELLDDTRFYSRRRADFERGQAQQLSASRIDLEAMIPVLEGRLPLLIEADRAADIEVALRLAREYRLRIMIGGGAEAWLVADQLAAAGVPVLTGAMNNIPGSFASVRARQENVALLRQAGVTVALVGNSGGGDEGLFNVRNIRYQAGNAVAYGMTWDDALRAVTLTPAELFGVADLIGSLRPGMQADVVVWSGDPFEFATRAEHVFVRGARIPGPSRQDELAERYRTMPPSYVVPSP